MPKDKAIKVVRMLGIPMYLREDGHLYQSPPGERIDPPIETQTFHGSGPAEAPSESITGSPVGSAAEAIP